MGPPPNAGTVSPLRVFRLASGRLAGATALPTLVQAPLAVAGANTLVQLDDRVLHLPRHRDGAGRGGSLLLTQHRFAFGPCACRA